MVAEPGAIRPIGQLEGGKCARAERQEASRYLLATHGKGPAGDLIENALDDGEAFAAIKAHMIDEIGIGRMRADVDDFRTP